MINSFETTKLENEFKNKYPAKYKKLPNISKEEYNKNNKKAFSSKSRSNSNSHKKAKSHKYSRSRSNSKSYSFSDKKNKKSRSYSSESSKKNSKKSKHHKKRHSKRKNQSKNNSYSNSSEKSRSRSVSYNSFRRRRDKYYKDKRSTTYKTNRKKEESSESGKSFNSQEFENKLKRFRYQKLNKINTERKFKDLACDKNKGNYIFNKSFLSNMIQENIRVNKRCDQEEIERATQKLHEVDKEAYNINKKVKLKNDIIL